MTTPAKPEAAGGLPVGQQLALTAASARIQDVLAVDPPCLVELLPAATWASLDGASENPLVHGDGALSDADFDALGVEIAEAYGHAGPSAASIRIDLDVLKAGEPDDVLLPVAAA